MLVLSADGKRIFTSNIASGTVTALEQGPGGGWRATHIAVGAGPEGIDMSPDGKEVWSAHSQDGGVSVISVETKKVTDTIARMTKHSNRIKFTPDGKRVLVSDPEAGEVVVIDAATHKEIQRIHTGGQPLGIQMEQLGNRAWVALAGEGAVAAIDLDKLAVTDKLPTGPGVDGMAWVK
ncbi:MAG TPA: cytochrome D1 domain-containing protein [Terriglobales bacterium]|nr:cytochrome D1 domain-containing protein [Terriglobales bacterium]